MAKRTGVPALVEIAKRMCTLIVRFTPIIQQAYPGNSAVLTALAAANAACMALSDELVPLLEEGV